MTVFPASPIRLRQTRHALTCVAAAPPGGAGNEASSPTGTTTPTADPPADRLASPLPAASGNEPERRVLVWIEASRAYGRGCLLGIANYAKTHSNWRVFHFEHELGENLPAHFRDLRLDGVIGRSENQAVADQLHELGVPIVDLRAIVRMQHGESLSTDPIACAELAFDHFWNRGFRRLAFCGFPDIEWSIDRRNAFKSVGDRHGVPIHVYSPGAPLELSQTVLSEARGEAEDPHLLAWLHSLPKPIAVFAANDVRGRQVVTACRAAGLAVPEQVAVIGVDNDDVVCELSSPPLSSIEPDARRLGWEGAARLDLWMNGTPAVPAGSITAIPPLKVMTRQSSDVSAIDDAVVAAAIRIIREQGGCVPSVAALADQVGVSRTTLERRFRNTLRRSPRQEMDRVRLDRARLLVLESSQPLHQIAEHVGYSNASRLLNAYRRRFGVTPGEERRAAPHTQTSSRHQQIS